MKYDIHVYLPVKKREIGRERDRKRECRWASML